MKLLTYRAQDTRRIRNIAGTSYARPHGEARDGVVAVWRTYEGPGPRWRHFVDITQLPQPGRILRFDKLGRG